MRHDKNPKNNGLEGKIARTTLILPESVDFYLDAHAISTQRPKGELVREALSSYLAKKGYDISKIPNGIPKTQIETELVEYDETIRDVMYAKASKRTRTTVFMTDIIDWFLNFHGLRTGIKKGEIIREAIALYLVNQGYNDIAKIPTKIKISFSY